MRKSKVLAKIRAGKVARICNLGHYIPAYVHQAAYFGYDGIWVDGEHRAFDPRESEALIAHHHLANIDCVWRAPTLEKTGLYRILEDGAAGVMIPHVSTPEKASMLVDAVKFPPIGDRGLDSAGLDANFLVNLKNYDTKEANHETFLAIQIETPEGLDNIDPIVAIPGVGVIFFGPGDYGLRVGTSAAVQEPKIMAAQKKIAAACKKHGKAWGRPVGSAEDVRILQEMGAQFLCHGSAFMGIHLHLKDCCRQFDEVLGESTQPESKTPATFVP